jgi:hypothetical protein
MPISVTAVALHTTFLLAEGGALLFRPPTTAADLFTIAKVNYKSSLFNVPLKPPPSLAFRQLLQCPAPLLASSCYVPAFIIKNSNILTCQPPILASFCF